MRCLRVVSVSRRSRFKRTELTFNTDSKSLGQLDRRQFKFTSSSVNLHNVVKLVHIFFSDLKKRATENLTLI